MKTLLTSVIAVTLFPILTFAQTTETTTTTSLVTPTATPTPMPTAMPVLPSTEGTPTATPTPSPTAAPVLTSTVTPTPTATPIATATPAAINTAAADNAVDVVDKKLDALLGQAEALAKKGQASEAKMKDVAAKIERLYAAYGTPTPAPTGQTVTTSNQPMRDAGTVERPMASATPHQQTLGETHPDAPRSIDEAEGKGTHNFQHDADAPGFKVDVKPTTIFKIEGPYDIQERVPFLIVKGVPRPTPVTAVVYKETGIYYINENVAPRLSTPLPANKKLKKVQLKCGGIPRDGYWIVVNR